MAPKSVRASGGPGPARDPIAAAAARLRAAGVEDARREAWLLHAYARGDAGKFAEAVRRRAGREPLALITGTRGFWTLDLEVSRDTLVPRPDSETLIEAALAALPERLRVRRILDLGTGTGCLLLAALSEFPAAFGVGVDVWPPAARLARRNAAACGLAARCGFLAGDWGAALAGGFDLVLCNPPYVAAAEIDRLMPEVRHFEPRRALDGGAAGLDAYRAVFAALPLLLADGGVAVLELGAGQEAAVRGLAVAAGLAARAVRPDLSGIPRALLLDRAPLAEAGG